MKKVLLYSLFICVAFVLNAQENPKGFHQHDGFYLSLCGGPVFGTINDEYNNGGTNIKFSGTGGMFDFKIGGTVGENLILHATLLSSSLPGPRIVVLNEQQPAPNELVIGEGLLGAGLTYYIMPQNVFLSGSAGLGNFTIVDGVKKTSTSTNHGFSMQLKIGKEWWVSKNWGLGVALSYSKTSLTNKAGNISEKLNSSRFSIMFNATFN